MKLNLQHYNRSRCLFFVVVLAVLATTCHAFSVNQRVPASQCTSRSLSPSLSRLHVASSQEQQSIVSQGEADVTSVTEQQQLQLAQQQAKKWDDDGFVFGLEGSGLERPTGRTASVVVEGDSLETQPYQVAIVSATFLAHAIFLSSSFHDMFLLSNQEQGVALATAATVLQAVLLTLSSWLLADFGSGVLHWSVDNYGNGRTPIMGGIIAAFQGHHSAPWTITQRGFCNNVYKLCLPFGMAPMSLIAAVASYFSAPQVTFFFTTFCIFEILSQEFHKWSHQLPSESPAWVNTLQKLGLTIARKPHAQHHLAPFEGNYCIISGVCNKPLDETGFFRRLERVIYNLNGVEPNAWKLDPDLRAKTLAGDYSLPLAK